MYLLKEEGESVSLFRKQLILTSLFIYGLMFIGSIIVVSHKYIVDSKKEEKHIVATNKDTIDSF